MCNFVYSVSTTAPRTKRNCCHAQKKVGLGPRAGRAFFTSPQSNLQHHTVSVLTFIKSSWDWILARLFGLLETWYGRNLPAIARSTATTSSVGWKKHCHRENDCPGASTASHPPTPWLLCHLRAPWALCLPSATAGLPCTHTHPLGLRTLPSLSSGAW